MRRFFFKATAVLLVAGCDVAGITPVCTAIGCLNGLNVELQGNIPAQFIIRAIDGNTIRERQCSDATCRSVVFDEFTPTTVLVEIIAADGSSRRQFTPSYIAVYPNGERCGGACRQAKVTFSL